MLESRSITTSISCLFNHAGGDVCCCTAAADICRIICEGSNEDLRSHPTDCFMCFTTSCTLGGWKTCCAILCSACCIECRASIPTDTKKTVPFVMTLCGWTFCYNSKPACSCFASLGELEDKYPTTCCKRDAAEERAVTVEPQSQASPAPAVSSLGAG